MDKILAIIGFVFLISGIVGVFMTFVKKYGHRLCPFEFRLYGEKR